MSDAVTPADMVDVDGILYRPEDAPKKAAPKPEAKEQAAPANKARQTPTK